MSVNGRRDSDRVSVQITAAQIADTSVVYYCDEFLRVLPYRAESAAFYTKDGALVPLPSVSSSGPSDLFDTAANLAARVPAGAQVDGYRVKVLTNNRTYVVSGGAYLLEEGPINVATIIARDALTEVPTGSRVYVEATNQEFSWNGSAWVPTTSNAASDYFTTLPPLVSYNVGDYVWLVDQVTKTDEGLYQKRQVAPTVVSWVQVEQFSGGSSVTATQTWASETFILSALDVANGYVTLAGSPADQEQMFVTNETMGGVNIAPGTGFTYNAGTRRLTWSPVVWSGFSVGDELNVRYLA